MWYQLGDKGRGRAGRTLSGRQQVRGSNLLERGRGFKGESQIRLKGSDWKLLLIINIHRETKGQDLVQQRANRAEITERVLSLSSAQCGVRPDRDFKTLK